MKQIKLPLRISKPLYYCELEYDRCCIWIVDEGGLFYHDDYDKWGCVSCFDKSFPKGKSADDIMSLYDYKSIYE